MPHSKNRIHYSFILIFIIFMIRGVTAQDSSESPISPRYRRLTIPDQGFTRIENNQAGDSCTAIADSSWMEKSGDSLRLLVAVDGPYGSGRYWTVTIALKDSTEDKPTRGICLETTTIGWRTLQYFKKLPLPWIDDQNANGQPEFILWDSFPLRGNASMAEFGLIGWVYEMGSKGNLELNIDLTHVLAVELASAYRTPLSNADDRFQQQRNKIARILEKFSAK
jgi:hypothetical protein